MIIKERTWVPEPVVRLMRNLVGKGCSLTDGMWVPKAHMDWLGKMIKKIYDDKRKALKVQARVLAKRKKQLAGLRAQKKLTDAAVEEIRMCLYSMKKDDTGMAERIEGLLSTIQHYRVR